MMPSRLKRMHEVVVHGRHGPHPINTALCTQGPFHRAVYKSVAGWDSRQKRMHEALTRLGHGGHGGHGSCIHAA